jgi:putative ABC transport system substrate-binding protein
MIMRFYVVGLLILSSLGLLISSLPVQAQTNIPRIGLLNPQAQTKTNAAGETLGQATVDAFRQGLQDLGYVEGKNILIEYRWAEGHPERLADLAEDLVRLQVDIIVTASMKAIRAAQKATATIPIVSGGAGDLVKGGLIASLAKPGGNITGLTDMNPELNGKLFETLKTMLPRVSRVAYLNDAHADSKIASLHIEAAQTAAQKLGLQLQLVTVKTAKALPEVFATMIQQGAEALVVELSVFTMRHRGQIVALAAQHRIPAAYQGREFVEVGGLMSYGTDRLDQWRRAATYVDHILKGAKPVDLPVQQPRKLEFMLNLKAAQALGLTVPPMILFEADEIIR